jgi:hypothetical protein
VALDISPAMVNKLLKQGMPGGSAVAAREWRRRHLNVAQRKVDPEGPDETREMARTRREIAEADIAEKKAAELEGELIRRSSVEKAEEKKAAAVRESLLQMPAQLAPVVAAEPDIAKCQDALMDAVLIVLGRISGAK